MDFPGRLDIYYEIYESPPEIIGVPGLNQLRWIGTMSLISRKNNIPIQALLGVVLLLAVLPACSIQRGATAKHPESYQINPWSLAGQREERPVQGELG